MRTGIRGKARTACGATACALAMLLVGSATAHAETTEIGETPPVLSDDFMPSQEDPGFARLPTACPADVNLVQAQTGATPLYSVPFDGVITEWSHRGSALAEPDGDAGQGKLLVWRPAGNDRYTLVGKSAAATFSPNALGTFETSIAVEEGDLLGLRTETDGVGCFFTHFNESSMDDEVRFQAPSSPDDAPAIPPEGGDDPLPDLGDEGVPGDVVDEECDPTEPMSCQPWFCETYFGLVDQDEACKGFSPPGGSATPSAAAEPEVGDEQAFAPVSGEGARLNVAAVLEPAPEPEPEPEEVVEAAEDEAPPPPAEEPPAAPAETEDTQPAPATPASTLALAGRSKQKLGRRVRVAARCLAEACEVVARGRLVVRIPGKGKGKGSVRTRRFALRPVSTTLGEGERTVLALTLRKGARKAARRALARRGGARVRVTVRAVNEAGNEVSVTRGIRVRRG